MPTDRGRDIGRHSCCRKTVCLKSRSIALPANQHQICQQEYRYTNKTGYGCSSRLNRQYVPATVQAMQVECEQGADLDSSSVHPESL